MNTPPAAASPTVVCRTMNRGVPITLARLVHPGTRYQLQGQFKP
jgi:GntR family histidine utilization transcriptional repressor